MFKRLRQGYALTGCLAAAFIVFSCQVDRYTEVDVAAPAMDGAGSECGPAGSSAVIDDSNCEGCVLSPPPDFDWTACINRTLHALGDNGILQFLRDSTYHVTSHLLTGGCASWSDSERLCYDAHQHNNVRLEAATGSGERPIIRWDVIPPGHGDVGQYHEAIKVHGHDVALVNLDIRGPAYNDSVALRAHHEGINAAHMSVDTSTQTLPKSPARLRLEGVSVNGFYAQGLVWTGTDLTIINSQFRWNAMTGLALFRDHVVPLTGVLVSGSDISHNGGDGIDMAASNALIENNTITHNGWGIRRFPVEDTAQRYERMAIVLNPAGRLAGEVMRDVTIRFNTLSDNELNGIEFISDANDSYDDIIIEDNNIWRNGHIGVHFGKRYYPDNPEPAGDVSIQNSFLRRATAGFNRSTGCNIPFQGVTTQNNDCLAGIQGPSSVQPNQMCMWEAFDHGGIPPFSYSWRADENQFSDEAVFVGSFSQPGIRFIQVEVRDAVGFSLGPAAKAVTVSNFAPSCG